MAAMTQSYVEAGRGWDARVAEWNTERFAAQKNRRRQAITPEFSFQKHFDNSRLVKTADPVRARQMRVFLAATVVLFSLVMIYGLQHFRVIETSYRVEAEKQRLTQLQEENRQLLLQAAQLSDPARLDTFARNHGLVEPLPGQVVSASLFNSNAPTVARVMEPAAGAR